MLESLPQSLYPVYKNVLKIYQTDLFKDSGHDSYVLRMYFSRCYFRLMVLPSYSYMDLLF